MTRLAGSIRLACLLIRLPAPAIARVAEHVTAAFREQLTGGPRSKRNRFAVATRFRRDYTLGCAFPDAERSRVRFPLGDRVRGVDRQTA